MGRGKKESEKGTPGQQQTSGSQTCLGSLSRYRFPEPQGFSESVDLRGV